METIRVFTKEFFFCFPYISSQDNFIQINDLRPTLAEGYREDEKARLCHKKRSLPVSPDQGSAMLTKEMVEANVVQVLPSTIQGDAIAPDEKLERASLLTDQYLSDPDVLGEAYVLFCYTLYSDSHTFDHF